ncbi:MAG: hypothetical protein A2287_02525 [Candidatus Melainabacteria bacterium RIFOXYA12_FULL_32_12]|nr:MAG: hypothetical protein A2255_00360 [Candidatus Melainabacteria bacterium RIFOXYA2_FULL_32_9]OGI30969.1 MAG: hypothetical protein A2287_02525 [Candidatus Melainabacteria bacterium RIFOXYA12_FULL_32_12]
MKQGKMILLPLDGSDISLKAVLPAKSIAILLNMIVHILYVSDETLSKEELIKKTRIKMEEFPRCIISHKKGNPVEVILEEAKNAEYVVMCTQGEGYDPEKISGSTATKVIENSTTPVLLIRPNIKIQQKDDLWEAKNVLIPLNGSPGAAQALEPTMAILSKTNAEIDLLHISVSEMKHPAESGMYTVPYYEDHPQHEWPSWSKEFLRRFGPTLKNHFKVEFFVSTGDPAEHIINFSKDHNNDLIAMAWHGKLAPPHANILRRVMYETPCPVLLTKINHKES